MKRTAEEIEQAKKVLEEAGYYTGNLWCVEDVRGKFKCTDDEAQKVLDGALNNSATMEQIWFAIGVHGEEDGLTPVLEIGDDVEMPDPNDTDIYNFGGWIGRIVDIRGEYADVEDGDGDVFSIELDRIELYTGE